ncbi:MAG: DNA repair protein RecO [Gammaproteobacteria bacterium]|nr:DNA repair protein RecO [Gammaproteobacteria bacterium]MBU1553389.1 DNA repair protein RecO [Gammaproteobacteria bacterium]MBU2071954.1 DNA repair protein RecO [Gammaproteobacteria bacterium]MBU2181815.1 DNA repair protein RecO [Gammaproteobacteria bacterium]MBU2204316.1 DNA repair protein RecO [Gammaproteobacteria bacterium]
MADSSLWPGFILHSRALGEDKLILQLLLAEHGRLSAVVRKKQGKRRLALQPFQLFMLQLTGRTELKTVRSIEEASPALLYSGTVLYSGLYLNELLCRLWPDNLASEQLFQLYQHSLQQLLLVQQEKAELEPCLRSFEFALLGELGLPIDWQTDSDGQPISAQGHYQWLNEQGFVAATQGYPGSHLLAIADNNWQHPDTRRSAKLLSRQLLAPLLGGKPLASRALFEQR